MRQYKDLFLEYLKEVRGCSDATVLNYSSDLNQFLKVVDKKIEEIVKTDIQKFIIQQKKDKRSPRTINRRLDCLSTFYEYLVEEVELDLKKPIRKKYKQKIKDKHGKRSSRVHPEDAKRIMKIVKPLDPEAHLAMVLMGKQGLRISEVRKLRLEQIDFKSNRISIIDSKGDDRTIPLAESVKIEILEYVDLRRTGPVLVWSQKNLYPYKTNGGLWKKIRKWMDKLGVIGTPHSWRRLFGTELYNKTKDIVLVQQMLGHKSIETTRMSYVDNSNNEETTRLSMDEIF